MKEVVIAAIPPFSAFFPISFSFFLLYGGIHYSQQHFSFYYFLLLFFVFLIVYIFCSIIFRIIMLFHALYLCIIMYKYVFISN